MFLVALGAVWGAATLGRTALKRRSRFAKSPSYKRVGRRSYILDTPIVRR